MDTEQLQQLKLAFVIAYTARIVAADGQESYEEFSMLGQVFPRPLLRQAEFLDDNDHLTDRWRSYRDMAHNVLPTVCAEDRVEIFELLFAACAVDDLAESEMAVLTEAGLALGFPEGEVTTMIGALSASASA